MSEAVTDLPPDLTTVALKQFLGHVGAYERAVNDGSLAYKDLLNRLQGPGDPSATMAFMFGFSQMAWVLQGDRKAIE